MHSFMDVFISHTYIDFNSTANELSKMAIDGHEGTLFYEECIGEELIYEGTYDLFINFVVLG